MMTINTEKNTKTPEVIGQGRGHTPPVPKIVIYTSKDTGPFIVLIDRIKVKKDTKLFYAISAGRILRKLKMIQVEMKHVGKHRNKLIFADRNEANTVLQSNVMESYNVKAYIPDQILYSTGVISGVPDDITLLAAEVAKKHPVNGVERIRKYNRTTKEMDDTSCVKITLKQNYIPETKHAFYVRHKFRPFVYERRTSANCLRFRHSKVKCCVHCNSQTHRLSDKKCKQYGLQLEMNRLIACEKLTYMEAREKVKKTKKTPTNEDFPFLITDAEEAPFSKGRNETPKSRPGKQQKENNRRSCTHRIPGM
jgi:hypothetical protein